MAVEMLFVKVEIKVKSSEIKVGTSSRCANQQVETHHGANFTSRLIKGGRESRALAQQTDRSYIHLAQVPGSVSRPRHGIGCRKSSGQM